MSEPSDESSATGADGSVDVANLPTTGPSGGADLDHLLEYLRSSRGFDFSRYKRASLTRRIGRRMSDLGITSYGAYLDRLEAEPPEFNALLDTILINVTGFFRDPELWDILRDRIIPALLDRRGRDGVPVRVWSAGCASGQEPYSLAMLFAEQVGIDALSDRVKIYATDIDEAALAVARRAAYTPAQLEGLPTEYFERYFEPVNGDDQVYVLTSELRRCVIFGQHNLVSDAPISRTDLVMCRNTLMYFDVSLQRDVVQRLHFSVAPDGYLVLGKVEMLLGHRNLFEPVDASVRIFSKRRATTLELAATNYEPPGFDPAAGTSLVLDAFDAGTVAQLVVDPRGNLAVANEAARSLFGLRRADVGRPFRDLEISYRPVELRTHIDTALARAEQVTVRDVAYSRGTTGSTHFDVLLTPLGTVEDRVGVLVTFIDTSRHHVLQERLEEARQDLETAYEEVQSTNEELETTNEELQSTNEELETTNEELQSTIEELETTNEELRSTNEEFETMNDELQRVNDQLAARNEMLHERTAELDRARAFITWVLDSLDAGVVVVDQELRVVTWSVGAKDLWGLDRSETEGRAILALDIGLPVEELARPIRAVLSGSERFAVLEVPSHNRRGQALSCRVEVARMTNGAGEVEGVVLLMEAVDSQGAKEDPRGD